MLRCQLSKSCSLAGSQNLHPALAEKTICLLADTFLLSLAINRHIDQPYCKVTHTTEGGRRIMFTHTYIQKSMGKEKSTVGKRGFTLTGVCSSVVKHYIGAYEVKEMGVWEQRTTAWISSTVPIPVRCLNCLEIQPNRRKRRRRNFKISATHVDS